MRTTGWIAASVVPVLSLLGPRVSHAQSTALETRAQVLAYSRGEHELLTGQFDAAERAFGESLRLGYRPALLELASVHRAQGHYASAIADLEAYLRVGEVSEAQHAALVANIEAMRPLEAHVLLRFAADASTRVQIDGREVPSGVAIELDPDATHEVHGEAAGFATLRRSLRLAAGEQRTLDLRFARESAPAYARWWFWTSVGAGVVTVTTIVAVLTFAHHPPAPDCGSLMPCITPQ